MVYAIYYIFSSKEYRIHKNKLIDFPNISIVISSFNEEEIIMKKFENLSKIHYPKNKIEIILIDDASTDHSLIKIKEAFAKFDFDGVILTNKKRLGANKSLNVGVTYAKNSIIVRSDADAMFELDALNFLIGSLSSSSDIGAVCGRMVPLSNSVSSTYSLENSYRNIYPKICTWESYLGSTYCFNGQLMAFKKEAFSPIREDGETGANLAFNIIRNGYRTFFVREAIFYEVIPTDIKEQQRQKIRRATRLIKSTISNLDLLGHRGTFGNLIYPLRFFMFVISPTLILSSMILWVLFFLRKFPIVLLLIIIFFGIINFIHNSWTTLIKSFLLHQIYLFLGLMMIKGDTKIWKPLKRVTT